MDNTDVNIQLNDLREALSKQTEEITRRAIESEKLRRAEEERIDQAKIQNELAQKRLEAINNLLAETRIAIQIMVNMIEPMMRHQNAQIGIITEFVRLSVQREMSHLTDSDRRQIQALHDKIEKMTDVRVISARKDLLKSLATYRANLAELNVQADQYGIRVPIDLVNEINAMKSKIEETESELANLEV